MINHNSALQHTTADIHIVVQSEPFDLSDEMLQLQNSVAVSYTHLTLPTICSV